MAMAMMVRPMLGLDVGDRRIGVALTETGLLAHRHSVIERRSLPADLDRISALVDETGAEEVVVGVPYSLDGTTGPQAVRTLRFVAELCRRCRVPVRIQDEALSTKAGFQVMIAEGVRKKARREQKDSAAAQVILQDYLNARGTVVAYEP